MAPPFLLASPFQAARADVIFVTSFLVRKMSQFHRLNDAIDDHRRSQTSPKSEEEHLPALVAPYCLQRRVVNDFNRSFERSSKVKSYPAASEVMRLGKRPISNNLPRISDRDCIILPVTGELLDSGNHPLRRKYRTGWKFPHRFLSSSENLNVSPAHIDHQNIHVASLCAKSSSLCLRAFVRFVVWTDSARFRKGGALRVDNTHEIVPRIDKRFRAFILKFCRQIIDVDTGSGELVQKRIVVPTIGRHDFADFAVIGERLESILRHGIHGERRSERLYVKDV